MRTNFLNNPESKNSALKREILRLCIIKGGYSIADLSRDTGTSVPTVTKFIGELMEEGFIQDLGKQGTAGGRRPSIYGLNPDAGYFIGVDISRQHFHIAIADFSGELKKFIQDIEFVLEASADSFRTLCALVKNSVVDSGLDWEKVMGVGVSLSGRVNPEKGYSLSYFVSEDLPLRSFLEQEFGIPVTIENDSRAMTFGEYLASERNRDENMLFINLSWGLGMGIVLNGKLYYGKSGFSGEIGHFPLLDNDKICRCGKVGCLETGASGSALHDMILERLAEGKISSLSKIYAKAHEVSLDEILQAVEEEDVLAIEGIEEVGKTLGRGIAGLINIFNPGLVVIGGRLIVGRDYLLFPIKTAVNKYSLNRVSSDTTIRFSELDRKAASVGDCLLSRSKLLGLM
jgi:transcriptional regulator of PTS gene